MSEPIGYAVRVNFTSADPDLRILAYRAGDLGFLASQRLDGKLILPEAVKLNGVFCGMVKDVPALTAGGTPAFHSDGVLHRQVRSGSTKRLALRA